MADAPPALLRKLDETARRYSELQESLNDPAVLAQPQRMIAASKESGQLDPIVTRYREWQKARDAVGELRELAADKADADMAEMAAAELLGVQTRADELLESLKDEFL